MGGGHGMLATEEGEERKVDEKVVKIFQEEDDLNESSFAIYGVLFENIPPQMPPPKHTKIQGCSSILLNTDYLQ